MAGIAAPIRRPRFAPSEPAPSRERHLKVAPEVAAHRLRNRLLVWLAFLVTGAALLTLVSFHVFAMQHEFALDRLEGERAAEQRRYERLRIEVATAASPIAIVAAAESLGMVGASGSEFVQAATVVAPGAGDDATSTTLDESWQDAKPSLGNEP